MTDCRLLDCTQWSLVTEETHGARCFNDETSKQRLTFDNPTNSKAVFVFEQTLSPSTNVKESGAGFLIAVKGSIETGTGNLNINDISLPLNCEAWIPYLPGETFDVTFESAANSCLTLSQIEVEWCARQKDLSTALSSKPDVLVITPEYPSDANLYVCAFAHTRNLRYAKKGLSVQVLSMEPHCNYQIRYSIDGIPVLVGGLPDLESLLARKQYKIVVTHFVDMHHYRIFDAFITGERLIFICHGPLETLFPMSPIVARPYFTPAPEYVIPDTKKIEYVRRYARAQNVDWVFVSQWQLQQSQELMGIQFFNAHVIHNTIDSAKFPYVAKAPDDRKKIMVLRRFENSCQHSIDMVIRCILELSKRDFFSDLHFDIFGDGSMFEALTDPVRDFPNVSLHQTFVPNEKINELHKQSGIALLPSRFDTQGVSMGEAASSGLVVIGSNISCVPYFMDEELNHTLADPENPIDLANIIERLYNNPNEFLTISKRLSERMRTLCSIEKTTDREIKLIQQRKESAVASWTIGSKSADDSTPLLTIAMSGKPCRTIGKCLNTLTNHALASSIEILVNGESIDSSTKPIIQTFVEHAAAQIRILNHPSSNFFQDAIQEARGRYIRFQQPSDWVNTRALPTLLKQLNNTTVDIVLTNGTMLYRNSPNAIPLARYSSLVEGEVYDVDHFTYAYYGIGDEIPNIYTSTYRVDYLIEAIRILPLSPTASRWQLETTAITLAKTSMYLNLDLAYTFSDNASCGPDDYINQSQYLIEMICSLEPLSDGFVSSQRLRLLIDKIIIPSVCAEIIRLNKRCRWSDIHALVGACKAVPRVYGPFKEASRHSAKLHEILKRYPRALAHYQDEPIILDNGELNPSFRSSEERARNLIRNITPFGIVEKRRERIMENDTKCQAAEQQGR